MFAHSDLLLKPLFVYNNPSMWCIQAAKPFGFCVFGAKWGNLFCFNKAGVFLGSDCQGANYFLITSHMESPDDGGQSSTLHHWWPSVLHEPPCYDTPYTTPHASINTALFSLQSKTCHFICPSLAPNHSDGQEREGGCVTASNVKLRLQDYKWTFYTLEFSGFGSTNQLVSIQNTHR